MMDDDTFTGKVQLAVVLWLFITTQFSETHENFIWQF